MTEKTPEQREDGGDSSRVHSILGEFFAAQPRVLDWGVVALDAPPPNADRLRSWVDEGLHAGLRFMEENLDKRADPRALFPWAKSVVLFAIRQPVPFGTDTGDFKVAAYALGNDYHRTARNLQDAIEDRLAEEFIVRNEHDERRGLPAQESASTKDAPSLRFSAFCDAWPVFERDLAAEAGLGWRGKNATLLSREHGSGFLLAGFFLDIDLRGPHQAAEKTSVREPVRDFCGNCTACLQACPTDAFIAPGRLDANKCISYWTIEHKGPIPEELATKFGDRIFGCDACQDVCPWNKKAIARDEAAGSVRGALPDDFPRAPEDWLVLLRKNGGLRARFRKTPLYRAGRKSLLRNVLIAMRNAGAPLTEEWREILKAEEDDAAVRAELER